MPKQKKAANQRTAPTRPRRQQTTETEDGMPEFRTRSTKALRLLLGQYQLQQTGLREELIARLEAHRNSRQTGTGNTNPENRAHMDRLELVQLITSIVDDRIQQQQKQAEQPNTRARKMAVKTSQLGPIPARLNPILAPSKSKMADSRVTRSTDNKPSKDYKNYKDNCHPADRKFT